MSEQNVQVTQADKDLWRELLGLPERNLRRREKGEPVVDALQLLARHRTRAEPDLVEVKLPRLTEAMIIAAGEAHYGKSFWASGGPDGVDLTANNINYTFRQGFKRMWAGVRAALTRADV